MRGGHIILSLNCKLKEERKWGGRGGRQERWGCCNGPVLAGSAWTTMPAGIDEASNTHAARAKTVEHDILLRLKKERQREAERNRERQRERERLWDKEEKGAGQLQH